MTMDYRNGEGEDGKRGRSLPLAQKNKDSRRSVTMLMPRGEDTKYDET